MATNHHRNVLSATTIIGDKVYNSSKEHLGKIEELMIDLEKGQISYAVLSFEGVLGLGDKFFAIPWKTLTVDQDEKCVILNVDKEKFKNAPGFDKDHWPDTTPEFLQSINTYYNIER